MRQRPPLDTDALTTIALDFRRAMEKSRLRRHAKVMARFPVGCCKHSSQLLACYLVTELHVPLVSFVHGERGGGSRHSPWQSHVWLSVNEHTLDITADQYDEIDTPVVVSIGSGWHSTWNRQRRLSYGEMMSFDLWSRFRFRRMYSRIRRAMDDRPKPAVRYPLRNAGPPAEAV